AGPAGIIVAQVATATVPAIHLPDYPTDLAPATSAPGDPPTATPTAAPGQTEAAPQTATLAPSATRRAVGNGSAAPATATASLGVAPDPSAFGVLASFGLESSKSSYKPGEKIWFDFALTNLAAVPLPYGAVGVILPDGSFHTSLSGSELAGSEHLSWRDWVSFPASGDQVLVLAMCFSAKAECRAAG